MSLLRISSLIMQLQAVMAPWTRAAALGLVSLIVSFPCSNWSFFNFLSFPLLFLPFLFFFLLPAPPLFFFNGVLTQLPRMTVKFHSSSLSLQNSWAHSQRVTSYQPDAALRINLGSEFYRHRLYAILSSYGSLVTSL